MITVENQIEYLDALDLGRYAGPVWLEYRAAILSTLRQQSRLREAAEMAVGETVIVNRGEFATFDGHWVMVEKFAMEALQKALSEVPQK